MGSFGGFSWENQCSFVRLFCGLSDFASDKLIRAWLRCLASESTHSSAQEMLLRFVLFVQIRILFVFKNDFDNYILVFLKLIFYFRVNHFRVIHEVRGRVFESLAKYFSFLGKVLFRQSCAVPRVVCLLIGDALCLDHWPERYYCKEKFHLFLKKISFETKTKVERWQTQEKLDCFRLNRI
jgi:hypothetical protein